MVQTPETGPLLVAESAPEATLDLRVYLAVLFKYKWGILGMMLLAALVGLYLALKAVPVYQASAKLQIERNADTAQFAFPISRILWDREFYETQYQLISSWGVAELAARKLGLLDVADPATPEPPAERAAFQWRDLLPEWLQAAPAQALSDEEQRAALIAGLQGSIQVIPVENSQLATIRILHPDPAVAAARVNAVADAYGEFLKDKNLENIQTDQTWYASRLDNAKADLDEANRNLQAFYERRGLLRAGEGVGSIQSQTLQTALTGQADAQRSREALERVYRDIVNARNGQGSLETITELENRGVVRSLKGAVVTARQEVTRLAQRYGPRHPTMIAAQSTLDNALREYDAELERVAGGVVTDYRRARAAEQGFIGQVEAAKAEIRELDRNRAEQQRLEDAVASSKAIFERLQTGEQTSGMLVGGAQKLNVTVIERARPARAPVRPDKHRMVLIAALVGLVLGIGLAFLLDHLDNTFKGPDEVENRLALPVLGTLPKLRQEKGKALQPMHEFRESVRSPFSESVRTIRTGVMLSGLDRERSVIMVTSSVPGEGKTTLSLNLAHAIGKMKKTLLIDADMRRPMVGKAHALEKSQPGLAAYVSGEARFEDCITRSEGSDLTVVHAGVIPPNPLELLSSHRLEQVLQRLRAEYDYIILDCAPALAVSDALVISRLSDAVLYVVRADATPFQAAEEGVRRLRRARAPVLGVVLNQVEPRGKRYYGKNYRYGYRYKYGYYDHYHYHEYYGKDREA